MTYGIAFRAGWLIAILTVSTGCAPSRRSAEPVRVVTFNIRFDNPDDGVHAWPNRRDWVASILRDSLRPDILGIQEALRHQVDDLDHALPMYDWVGVGRDDGADAGELSPVFYRRDRFRALGWGTIWLSTDPDSVGSIGWDAALPRIATWLRLRPRDRDTPILVVNTHFDHVGSEARLRSAELLTRTFASGPVPFILMGDLNLVDTTAAYRGLVRDDDLLTDTWIAAGAAGMRGTFSGFDAPGLTDRRIDYVLASRDWMVLRSWAADLVENRRYPSDHRPVVSHLVLR